MLGWMIHSNSYLMCSNITAGAFEHSSDKITNASCTCTVANSLTDTLVCGHNIGSIYSTYVGSLLFFLFNYRDLHRQL